MTTPDANPIVAVTVFPDKARVTRRRRDTLAAGEQRVTIGPLPLTLDPESVRVTGRGPATILGVDVVRQHQARTADELVAALEEQRRDLTAQVREVDDTVAVLTGRIAFLEQLGQRAGTTYARTLATGQTAPEAVVTFADSLTSQLTSVRAQMREQERRRELLRDQSGALERRLKGLASRRAPDTNVAQVALDVTGDGPVELELSYLVPGAGWSSSYDLRLDGDTLAVTWFGLITQHTGEDWPECDLALSTARPSGAVSIPDLDPWYLDRLRPMPVAARSMAYGKAAPAPAPYPAAPGAAPAMQAMSLDEYAEQPEAEIAQSTVEQGPVAATYRPARPVAVPADGSSHRATVAAFDLSAALDHITAPSVSAEAHLRATVVNTSSHTLPPGRASVFHGADFVGATALTTWSTGEEVELALGVDDRVRIERELVRRTATKATLGTSRRRELLYRTTVANHTGRPARITVLDQLPVSRDESITVREVRAEPAPAERTDLGVLTWKLELAPNQSRTIELGFRVDTAKGVDMLGWRE